MLLSLCVFFYLCFLSDEGYLFSCRMSGKHHRCQFVMGIRILESWRNNQHCFHYDHHHDHHDHHHHHHHHHHQHHHHHHQDQDQDQDTVYSMCFCLVRHHWVLLHFFLWACDAKYVLKSMCVQFGNALHDWLVLSIIHVLHMEVWWWI